MMKKAILLQFMLLLAFISWITVSKEVVAAGTAGDVVRLAESQIGYHEKASNAYLDDKTANSGSANYNKYARDVGVGNGQPWCATFVWWCMQSAGVPSDKYPRVTYATRDWFRSRGLWHDRGTYIPKPGDYVAFGSAPDHCGIVRTVSGRSFTTVEGNSSDSVKSNSYTIDSAYVLGFGEIKYSGTSASTPTINSSNPGHPYAIPSGNIGQGSSGDGTRWIQTSLNNLIGAGLAVDGIFGSGTKQAVVNFQSANGLTADGIVGNDTRSKMLEVWARKQDTVKPVIKNAKVTEKCSTYYIVECDVSDNVGVTKVQFPSWSCKVVNGTSQDDLKWTNGTISNGHAKAIINVSEHNNEAGPYLTHIYAWDAAGNSSAVAIAGEITLPQITDGTVQNLGQSFTARIMASDTTALTQSSSNIITTTYTANNKAQQWKFSRNSDGTYYINNLGDKQNLDLYLNKDADGATIHTNPVNTSDAQKWYVYKYKSGKYYFVPKVSKFRVLDRDVSSGKIHLWAYCGGVEQQRFGLNIVDEEIPSPSPTTKPTTKPTAKPSTASPSPKPSNTQKPYDDQLADDEFADDEFEDDEFEDNGDDDDEFIDDEFQYYDDNDDMTQSSSSHKNNNTKSKVTVGKVKNVRITKSAKKIKVKWKKISGAKGYEIQVARNKSFTRGAVKKSIRKNNAKITGFKKNKTYYIRIRAYKKSASGKKYGKWSIVKKVKVKKQ